VRRLALWLARRYGLLTKLERERDEWKARRDGLEKGYQLLESDFAKAKAAAVWHQEPCESCGLAADGRWASNLCPYCSHAMGVGPARCLREAQAPSGRVLRCTRRAPHTDLPCVFDVSMTLPTI
jgi:hypothetical protein